MAALGQHITDTATTKPRPITREVAAWAANLTIHDLPDPVLHHLRRVLLDHLGAVISGSVTRTARTVAEYAEDLGGTPEATVVAYGDRLSAPQAAWINGTAAHALDVDDGYTPGSLHPAAPALPAVLAVAEARDTGTDRVLVAMAIALEITCRLAEAAHPATWRRGFHNTPLAGTVGAAAGVAALLEADEETIASALGVAGSHAGGLFEFLGSGAEVKRLHAGKAARDAVTSAELAVRGLTGPTTVLEGTHGFLRAFAGEDHDPEVLVRNLGHDWAMTRTYFKPYPCCRHLHAPIDAVLALRDQVVLDDVDRVLVESHSVAARHDLICIDGLLDAQMSIPYAVVLALEYGVITIEQYSPTHRADERLRDALRRVQVSIDPELDAQYPARRPARVTIERANGPPLVQEIEQPLGEPTRPISDDDLTTKFLRLVEPVAGTERARRIADLVWTLDDLRAVFSALRFAAADDAPGAWEVHDTSRRRHAPR